MKYLAFIFIMFSATASTIYAEEQHNVGVVLDWNCPGLTTQEPAPLEFMWVLRSNGDRDNITIVLPLFPGDEIMVTHNSKCRLSLIINGEEIPLDDKEHIKYTVKVISVEKSYFSSLLNLLFPEERPLFTLGSNRGYEEELIIPMFVALPTEKYLLAGRQEFRLSWKGGVWPYRVRLYEYGSDRLLMETEVAYPEVQLQLTEPLLAGQKYWLEINSDYFCRYKLKDPGWCDTEAVFTAKAAEEFPNMPTELRDSGYSPLDQELLFTTWLLDRRNNQRAWLPEAYQKITFVNENKGKKDVLSQELSEAIIRYGFQ